MSHPLRSGLSVLGIVFGVIAIVTMLSIGEGAKQETLQTIEQLGINNIIVRQLALSEGAKKEARSWGSFGLKGKDVDIICKNVSGIERVCPIHIMNKSLVGSTAALSPEIIATTPAFFEMKGLSLKMGRFLCDRDVKNKNTVCVIGDGVAKALGSQGQLGKTLKLSDTNYTIIGVLKSPEVSSKGQKSLMQRDIDMTLFVPLVSYESTVVLQEVIFQFSNSSYIKWGRDSIEKILRELHGGYGDLQIIVPQELIHQVHQARQTFDRVLLGIACISLLVGGIGIMNMMLISVTERMAEIGIRRALGATREHILRQFLSEACVLIIFGACFGIIGGCLLSYGTSLYAHISLVITPWSIVVSLIMTFGVGLGAGLYPAYKASQMDPILALRSQR